MESVFCGPPHRTIALVLQRKVVCLVQYLDLVVVAILLVLSMRHCALQSELHMTCSQADFTLKCYMEIPSSCDESRGNHRVKKSVTPVT